MMNESALNSFNGIVRDLHVAGAAGAKLTGKSFVAKDLFDVAGYTTGAGNPTWLETHEPATITAVAVETLVQAGASLLGKSCTDELALSLDGINIHYGTPINPQAPQCIPGGSSSGSASVVASGLADFAIGTDTAGSVRVPASYCGIYGFRPTHGRISTDGVVPLGPDFDTVGWFARDPELLELCGQVLLGESSSEQRATCMLLLPDTFALISKETSRTVFEATDALKKRFALSETLDFGNQLLQELVTCFAILRGWQAWECHGAWIEKYHPVFAPQIQSRFMQCKAVKAEDKANAEDVRQRAVDSILKAIPDNSVICIPTTGGLPPLKTAGEGELPTNRTTNMLLGSIASVAGLPQVTVPIEVSDQMMTGLSFVGAPGTDMMLLNLARYLAQSPL